VDDRFYKIDLVFILDGAELDEHCRRKEQVLNGTGTTTSTSIKDMDERVRSCLDDYATKQHETFKSVAVAVFTRRTMVRDEGGGAIKLLRATLWNSSKPQMHPGSSLNQVIRAGRPIVPMSLSDETGN
jgi:hypothetical protein